MPKRKGAVHVAKIVSRQKGREYTSYLLRRTFREGGKVKHETLGNISHLPLPTIELIRGSLQGKTYIEAGAGLTVIRTLPHGNVAAVLGTFRKIGLEKMIASTPSRERDLVVAMIVSRVLNPGSKLTTARDLQPETATSTLGSVLGVEGADEDDLYGAMDWLLERQGRIEKKLSAKHFSEGCLVLYDLSSSYYTGTHCSLARFGHNRDRKRGFPQINYGLLCNAEGTPVAIEVFPGDTGDPSTLGPQIEKIRNRFQVRTVVLVGDRGMITQARLEKEIKPVEGLEWITALRAPALKKLADQKILQPSLFDKRDLAEIQSPDFPGERLVACFNPLLAFERAQKREDLLLATERELEKIVEATKRAKRPLRGKDKIGLRLGKVLNRFKMGKHFKIAITETSFSYERNKKAIAAEAALDGIYIIRTSVSQDAMKAEDVVKAYKGLDVVERAFRSLKTVDLKVRPIFHRNENRVRAHVFLCMLAYYVEWHMRKALAPILFDEDDPEGAAALRESIVAPAQRSESAKRKARAKRTEEGLPVLSFRDLLKLLETIARNRVQAGKEEKGGASQEFDLVTIPNRIQRKALDLLGVPLVL